VNLHGRRFVLRGDDLRPGVLSVHLLALNVKHPDNWAEVHAACGRLVATRQSSSYMGRTNFGTNAACPVVDVEDGFELIFGLVMAALYN